MIKIFWLWYNGNMDPSNNNSFGSFGSGANARPIVLSGSGDVVLPMSRNDNGKRRKRGLIIVGIILVLVAAGLGVTALIMNLPRNESTVTETGNYVDDFNIFANYVVNGEKKTEKLDGEYDRNKIYYIDEMSIDETSANESGYFAELKNLWNTFYEDYSVTEDAKNENYVINVYVDSLSRAVDFMEKYENAKENERMAVMKDYLRLADNEEIDQITIYDTLDDVCSKIVRMAFSISDELVVDDKTVLNAEGGSENEE